MPEPQINLLQTVWENLWLVIAGIVGWAWHTLQSNSKRILKLEMQFKQIRRETRQTNRYVRRMYRLMKQKSQP